MSDDWKGAIDCDFHPRLPKPLELARYMDDMWRDTVEVRGIDAWESIAYPPNAPLTVRPDWRQANADADPQSAAKATLDRFGFTHAICNSLFPVQTFRDENLAAVFARALNDWLAAEWLDKDPRLRGSVVLPIQSASTSRRGDRAPRRRSSLCASLNAGDGRASAGQIAVLAHLRGCRAARLHRRHSCRQQLSPSRHGIGWPTHYLEDYAAQALGFHAQLGSLISEGVFVKFPKLKVVLIESGVTWLPACLWRLSKFWRGLRNEVPWIDRSPEEIVRDHVRLTVQPFDGPPAAEHIGRLMDQLQSDAMLLFATDFPHWQYDGDQMLPAGLAPDLRRKILIDNPLATYPRLGRPT